MSQTQFFDISGGMQTATSWQLKQPNEVYNAENMRFDKYLGGAKRRLGYSLFKQFIVKSPLAFFEAKFTTGVKIFYAYNNTGNTATVLSCYDVATDTSTDVKSDYPVSTKLQMVLCANELYVVGISAAGARQAPINVNSSLTVSTTRNLIGAPKAQFVGEMNGVLYLMNVQMADDTIYPDRIYVSSPPRDALTYVNAAVTASDTIKLDSARYVKVGMEIDIYAAGTTNKLYNRTVATVNNSTDIITVTGGTVMLSKTDEIWLEDRFADETPTLLWNTDYRSPQKSDFIYISPGKVADPAITGWANSNNRLNVFTKTSMWQYDNANFITIYGDIGCINNDTICANGTWIIWLDAKGIVRARDSSSGQDQIISRAMKNQYLENLSATNLTQASAVMYDSNYKLSVGTMTIDGASKITRFVYNFDMNVWWREKHTRRIVLSITSSLSGTNQCYFLDDVGGMWLDETTNLDSTDAISWFLQYGRRNLGVSSNKALNGVYVYSDSANGSPVMVKTPGIDSQWKTIGQITSPITTIEIPDTIPIEGRDFDFKISGSSRGDSALIEGIEVWSHVQQTNFS